MTSLNLQTALERLIASAQIGQQKGIWTSQESVSLHEAILFFVHTPIMVVPPQLLKQQNQEVDMTSQRVTKEEMPLGPESLLQQA
jgi:hypothetical protein